MSTKILTGVKPTGEPHVGNLLAAIQPVIDYSAQNEVYLFIANYHAMTTVHDAAALSRDTYSIAATYLAFGLDPQRSFFYRQSDVPEIFELSWILSCHTPKGFMNRAHAYKDVVAKNQEAGQDPDDGVNMGLFGYPVLMSADILMFDADRVPVGPDQKQHVEFARDIAQRVNRQYGVELFKLPEAEVAIRPIVGLDGRKMSKSYNNTLPLFLEPKALRKLVNRIVTNSQTPEEPKNPDESSIFAIHSLLISPEEEARLRERYLAGNMGWGTAKSELFERLESILAGPREEYKRLMADLGHLDSVLSKGAQKARAQASSFLDRIKETVGSASKPLF